MAAWPTISEYAILFGLIPETCQPLSFQRYEYLRQPLDDLAARVVLLKGAQVGATVLAMLRALWFVDVRQMHTLYLFPTHRSALRFSRGRLRVLLERSPRWRRLFGSTSAGSPHLRAGHVNWYCHGGRSRVELLSMPVQYLTIDERDAMYDSQPLEQAAWSAVALARQRLAGQREAWELTLSTPTVPGRGIALDFAQSDQRHFEPRCPHCHRWVRLSWPAVIRGLDGPPAEAAYCCPRCDKTWSEAERAEAVAQGVWVADYAQRPIHGYYVPQYLSPAQTAPRLAAGWQEAEGNAAALQVFWNATLGLPYVAEGARLEARYLEAAQQAGGYPMASAPTPGSVLGLDVGPQWLHGVLAEPLRPGLRVIWIGKFAEWQELRRWLHPNTLAAVVVDGQPETHQARALALAHPGGYTCWYVREQRGLQVDPVRRQISINRTEALDAMFQIWRRGQVVLPAALPSEFRLHLQSPVRLYRTYPDGRIRASYVEAGGPDHYAHAMTYCLLAALVTGADRLAFRVGDADAFTW